MRLPTIVVCLVLFGFQAAPLDRLTVSVASTSYAVLRFRVEDGSAAAIVAAVDVLIDGRKEQLVLLTPGTRRPSYETLLGPLAAGSHDIRIEPSTLWNWDRSLRLADTTVEIVSAGDRRAELFRHAPAVGLRPDTIGTASDLPLMMYVEDATESGARWLRYTIVFSNEDGGTAGTALMARWGRTTDIELAYEVEVREGRAIRARYQGPDHRMLPRVRLDAEPPTLLVSTLNNMFLDRGYAAAVVRMVPEPVDLSGRSRESVMDERPWIYRVMARELAQERPVGVGDPRDYLYVDLTLESRGAGVALGARSADGTTRWSDRGRPELVVSRQGEIRIAVPSPANESVQALVVRCDPRPESGQSADAGLCTASIRKAFRLDGDHQPGPSILKSARVTVDAGIAREIPITRPAQNDR